MRRSALLLPLALVAALAVAPSARAQAPTVVPATPDYASEAFADPWDYANVEDVLVDQGPVLHVTEAAVAEGQLRFAAAAPAFVSLVHPGYPGALYLAREGPAAPIDAERYRNVALRLYAERTSAAGVFWDGCAAEEGNTEPACGGSVNFIALAGWHTYVLDVAGTGSGHPWGGDVVALRLSVGPSQPTRFALDWARVYAPTAPPVALPALGGLVSLAELHWDADDDAANNTPDNPGWGRVAPDPDGPAGFDAAAYPPGTYRFMVGPEGPTVGGVVIDAPPLPVILDPDVEGGEDYITAATGDPWDFGERSDVRAVENATRVSVAKGWLHGTNGGRTPNDPHVVLRWAGRANAVRYHRLTIRTTYDGPFGLADAPGGGMHGRWSWRRADMDNGRFHVPETVVQSREVVTYSTVSTYTVDLLDNAAGDVMETDMSYRNRWLGSSITGLRWDVNEDRGPRRWRLDEVALRADDESHGRFVVRWTDRAHRPGTVVAIYADRDRAGFDGELVAEGRVQREGRNSYRWDTSGVRPGAYWLYVVATNGASTSRAYATGPLRVWHPWGPAVTG
jgi:hypothetical protein